ncbi:hypothetical protein K402DRAFT_370265 [Aulographum hederae CBS 113979]|uniref:F-box domain-containing protein n=1 Tax=Aulographum hederae CBS 113979 TaxID=1176131 RepID=A0A6G1HAU0_9PEZI|nr:hypothetical protein K402DRAFT_370265 [Aulographum hederae CBS 113979]
MAEDSFYQALPPEQPNPATGSTERTPQTAPLLSLPSELLTQILGFLKPRELASAACTCNALTAHANQDVLWQVHVQQNFPYKKILSPHPYQTYRDLYVAHDPFWFISRHGLWIADNNPTGKLLIARFSQRRNCIEAYTLVAERQHSVAEFWEWRPDVIIHSFQPKVALDLNQPVLRLSPSIINQARSETFSGSFLPYEIPMDLDFSEYNTANRASPHGARLFNNFITTRPYPESLAYSSAQIWPPLHLPAPGRARNKSSDSFRSSGHHPMHFDEMSEYNFRIRRWMEFAPRTEAGMMGASFLIGEDVTTFGTLPRCNYTSTKKKPFQGIWAGDYSGHGSEFICIIQRDSSDPLLPQHPLPQGVLEALEFGSWASGYHTTWDGEPASNDVEAEASFTPSGASSTTTTSPFLTPPASPGEDDEDSDEDIYTGRLDAVKLTGDPNVPRGEYTFIAPDIGSGGLIRVASEARFAGARVVRAVGHVAARGFRDDAFTASQLIIVGRDTLAMYWEEFGHISYYHRVDIEQFWGKE